MSDLDSDEDEEELITSENKRKDALIATSTAISCTSTQAEPSTSNESLDNRCHLDTGAETTAEGMPLEAETNKDDHRKDEMPTTNEEGEQSEDGGSAEEQVTNRQSCEKVTKMNGHESAVHVC